MFRKFGKICTSMVLCSFVKTLDGHVLIKCLYNKYFDMNTSFRISLMYLLLLIPHHGNTPLPVMDSWLKKDQDDGFVQRDMTSSLTGGDESFGSAHQTYQNSLIRKKKSDTFVPGNSLPTSNYRNLALKFNQNPQYETNLFFKPHHMNNEYNAPTIDKERGNTMYESFEDSKLPYSKFLAGTLKLKSSMAEPRDTSFLDMDNNRRTFLKDNVKFFNGRSNLPSGSERSLNSAEDLGKSGKWSMCKKLKTRYAPNPFSQLQPKGNRDAGNFDENAAFQNDFSPLEDEQTGHQVRTLEYKNSNKPEGKNPQIFDENEYYEVEENPMNAEGNLNLEEDDYNQMLNDHVFMHKRDDRKQFETYPKMRTSESDTLKAVDSSKTYMSDPSAVEAMQEDLSRSKKAGDKTRDTRENSNDLSDPELVWKLTSDLRSKELDQVMKNSQKALQEVQDFQQKMSYKALDANESEELKRPIRDDSSTKIGSTKTKIDEKRLKREDEDEQKNMKTGTDEGGGGEYEDEEGKGHKDEEEYYEDADLSNDESGSEMQKTSELNQKYAKREVPEGVVQSKNSKEKNDNDAQDYELSLENAPVENSEKSKKVAYQEREKTKNSSERKGVKIWDEWGKWSPCSVTCGVGRSTRWRHCIGGGCAQGEKEAQIKRCTNPAC